MEEKNIRKIGIVGPGPEGLHEAILVGHKAEAKTILVIDQPQEQTVVTRMKAVVEMLDRDLIPVGPVMSGRENRRARRKKERKNKRHGKQIR